MIFVFAKSITLCNFISDFLFIICKKTFFNFYIFKVFHCRFCSQRHIPQQTNKKMHGSTKINFRWSLSLILPPSEDHHEPCRFLRLIILNLKSLKRFSFRILLQKFLFLHLFSLLMMPDTAFQLDK